MSKPIFGENIIKLSSAEYVKIALSSSNKAHNIVFDILCSVENKVEERS